MAEYIRSPYVPDQQSLLDLMRMAAQDRSRSDLQRAQLRSQGVMNIGELIAGTLASFRQDRERQEAGRVAQQRQEQEDAFKRRDQQLREADLLARIGEREQATARQREIDQRQATMDAQKAGDTRAKAIGYGPMAEMDVDTVMQSPERAGDVRYAFGPGTADGPELMPTREQRRGIETENAIKQMGGTIGPNGQVVMPPKPEREPNPTEASLAMLAAKGDKGAERALQIIRSLRQTDRAPDALVPVVGPDGKTRYGTRTEARGQLVPSSQQKPATGLEKRALNFFNRAQQADTDLETMEEEIQKMNLGGQTWMSVMPNFLQSGLGQRYTQAQRAFTEARLRKDSGAAIPENEFESDRKTYFVQPGDDLETQEQKRRARATMLASLGFESGQALGEFLGDSEEASKLVQGYRERSQRKAADTGLLVTMVAPDGTVKNVPPDQVKHFESLGAKVKK